MPFEDPAPDDRPGELPRPETSIHRHRGQSQRDFELDFFARILERDPFHAGALRVHAGNLAARGEYTRALQLDRRLVRLQPERPIPWYNLACTYALLGMHEPAFTALERALGLGYRHLKHMAKDPDLAGLHRDPRFTRLLLGDDPAGD